MSSNVSASDQCDNAKIRIGPLTLQRLERNGAIALVGAAVAERRKLDLAICNAHTVLLAIDDSSYADVLNRMTLLNDGVGVNLASRMVSGAPFPANLNGTDLIPELLSRIGRPLRLFLLGASQASVEGAARHIADTYPEHEITGFRNGYFAGEEIDGIIETINAGKVDLLMVRDGQSASGALHHRQSRPAGCDGLHRRRRAVRLHVGIRRPRAEVHADAGP